MFRATGIVANRARNLNRNRSDASPINAINNAE